MRAALWETRSCQKSPTQEFELGMTFQGLSFEYIIHLEQKADYEKPRIIKEQVTCNKKSLLCRNESQGTANGDDA